MAARVPWGEGVQRRAFRSARLRKKACRLELLLFRSARLAGSFDRENPGKTAGRAAIIYIVINIIVTFAMRYVEHRVAVPGLIGAKPAVSTH
jgi:hypothetical protein